jgi:hypothetical protein
MSRGQILPQDIGKRMYLVGRYPDQLVQVENNEQRAARLKKNPARRRAKKRRVSERGFFPRTKTRKRRPLRPRKAYTHKALRNFPINLTPKKAQMRDVVARLTRGRRRNPAAHIKHSGSAYDRARATARRRIQRQYRRAGGPTGPYKVQVRRKGAGGPAGHWLTLASFPFKASATDYGRALKHRYPSKSIRVFW